MVTPSYSWMDRLGTDAAFRAVECEDEHRNKIYVGRTTDVDGQKLLCKIIPNLEKAYVTYNGEERRVYNYKILCERTHHWIRHKGGPVNSEAVVADEDGEVSYVGKIRHNNSVTFGMVHPPNGSLQIPGKTSPYKQCDILVWQ